MPFDATPQAPALAPVPVRRYTGVARVLDEALALLGPNGEHWIKGSAREGDSYCVIGAIRVAADDEMQRRPRPWGLVVSDARSAVLGVIRSAHIASWNDAQERQFSEVRSALLTARDIAAAAEPKRRWWRL